jgi:hypothetical protein
MKTGLEDFMFQITGHREKRIEQKVSLIGFSINVKLVVLATETILMETYFLNCVRQENERSPKMLFHVVC